MSPPFTRLVSGSRSQEQISERMSSARFVIGDPSGMGPGFVIDVGPTLTSGSYDANVYAGKKIGTPIDTPSNRLSQWTISDYYRDSFVQRGPDTPPPPPPIVAARGTSHQHDEQEDAESINSYYGGVFNDNAAHQPEDSFEFDRNQRWPGETEDVPDRHPSYRERANQQFEELDQQNYSYYDNLFDDYDTQQPETAASISLRITRRQEWSEESDREDMPDRRLTFGRQQSEDLPPTRGRNLRWSEETEDVPDRHVHPRYRRY